MGAHLLCSGHLQKILFQIGQDYGAEDDFRLPDAIQIWIKFQRKDHLAGLLFIHEAFGDGVGGQQFVALEEFLEGNAVGETLAAGVDAFQDTVATQLVQYQRSLDLPGLFLVVGDDQRTKLGFVLP